MYMYIKDARQADNPQLTSTAPAPMVVDEKTVVPQDYFYNPKSPKRRRHVRLYNVPKEDMKAWYESEKEKFSKKNKNLIRKLLNGKKMTKTKLAKKMNMTDSALFTLVHRTNKAIYPYDLVIENDRVGKKSYYQLQ